MQYFDRFESTNEAVSAQLYETEVIVLSQDDVGLYDGKERNVAHDNGRLYLTSHRLIYIDLLKPLYNSRHLPLSSIRQTEYWAGFINSSPKITLLLGQTSTAPHSALTVPATGDISPEPSQAWICHVCGFSNARTATCGLCGVKRIAKDPPSRPPSRSSPIPSTSTSTVMPDKETKIACAICTFLNHPSLSYCEMCGSPLANASPYSAAILPSRTSTPDPNAKSVSGLAEHHFARLSFRKGGVTAFYAALKKSLTDKAWELEGPIRSASKKLDQDRLAFGLNGIMQSLNDTTLEQSSEMQDALSDLNALMTKAKEMVEFATLLNSKIPSDSASIDQDSSAKTVRKTLVNLGLSGVPVTSDMVKDEREYHQELAIELAGLLTGAALSRPSVSEGARKPLMTDDGNGRGLMVLDEVWCIWNRARGVSMIAPKDFREACNYLPIYTWPSIELRTFATGLTVLHTKRFKEAAFQIRIANLLSNQLETGVTTIEIAQKEQLPVGLAFEMLESIEKRHGTFVRDEKGHEGIRWFAPNLILEFEWQDPN